MIHCVTHLCWHGPNLTPPMSMLAVWLSLRWVSHCSLFIHESQKWHLGNVPNLLGILAPRLLTSFTADMGTGQTYNTYCSELQTVKELWWMTRCCICSATGVCILHALQRSLRLRGWFLSKGIVMKYLLCSEISLKTKTHLSSPLPFGRWLELFFTWLTWEIRFASRVSVLIYLKAPNTLSACRYCCCHGNKVIYA